jgi:MFS transporter, PPP family, 3-phenylpropionic acid transporter
MQKKYWRLSRFYFFYFASLGALIPFWTVYLDSLGFSSLRIGQLMATLALSKVVAPYLWGWVADRTGYHIRIVQLTSLLSLLCFLPLLWYDSFWSLLWLMLLFSFFWNASLPQFEVVTLSQLGSDKDRYSQIRLWGSLGFIVTAAMLGGLFQTLSINFLPVILLMIFSFIWLSTLPVKEHKAAAETDSSILMVLRKPQVMALLVSCFFLQASHGPYYTFYSLYMESLDYSRFSIGLLWSLGVLAEVVLFMFMPQLLKIRAAAFWLVVAFALTSLRWVLMAWFSDVLILVILIQCLHAASFGLFHATSINLIQQYFHNHHGRGQALYASVSFGAGGALGSFFAGSLWENVSPQMTFMIAAVTAFIGLLVALQVQKNT